MGWDEIDGPHQLHLYFVILLRSMTKLKHLLLLFTVLTHFSGWAQGYTLRYTGADRDSAALVKEASLQQSFASRMEASAYVARLSPELQAKGFITASLDSVQLDSLEGRVHLYLGEQYRWARIKAAPRVSAMLEALRWNENSISGLLNFEALREWQQKVLDQLEEQGYPFGSVYLDSIEIRGNEVSAVLALKEGPLYHIDSIRVYGDARISNLFLQRYLEIPNGSAYNRKKLEAVSRRLSELTYLEEERPSQLTLLGTGSVLDLYLKPRRTSQVNALIGFLPNTDISGSRKLLLTVDANVLLRNALGGGETIGLVWQQLQKSSPRLNLVFEQPYIFRSRFGLNFSLDMYKRDSTFLNLNINLGTSYRISDRQTGGLFLQRRQTIVNGVNVERVRQTRQLPSEADVSSINLGAQYQFNSTDYRFNPRKGTDWSLTATAGTKTLRKNTQVLELEDPFDPSFKFESLYDTVQLRAYQFRVVTALAHYFPMGRQGALKTAFQGGLFQSGSYYRNELFQIGGYKLLRGFDEESQFVSRYAVGTLEYRYLVGRNSAFFAFVDGGYGRHQAEAAKDHTYLGTGLGLSFETKAGIINLAWAIGQRDDVPFNLRQSKLHLGFASYF